MKVLIINASPHGEKSYTLKVTNAFVDGLKSAGGVEVKYLELNKLKINNCIGCYTCWKVTPGVCIFEDKDDERMINDYILAADLVIYSFPLYFFAVPAKLKAMMERQLPLMSPLMTGNDEKLVNGGHKFRFERASKRIMLISTSGFYYAPSTYDSVMRQFDMIYGEGKYDNIFIGEGELLGKPYLKKKIDRYLSNITAAGHEYYNGEISAETKGKIEQALFPIKFYAEMADQSWGTKEDAFDLSDKNTEKRVSKIRDNFEK